LWADHPIIGAGPGAFQEFTPLGRDTDTASAHSSVLQVGAETGWVGVALFALLALAGLLWAGRGVPAYAVVASAAWTALLVHSFVDHLLDFPAIVLTAGVVIGWAGASRGSEELDVPHGQRPRRG
jgi:O-antigen ligase